MILAGLKRQITHSMCILGTLLNSIELLAQSPMPHILILVSIIFYFVLDIEIGCNPLQVQQNEGVSQSEMLADITYIHPLLFIIYSHING